MLSDVVKWYEHCFENNTIALEGMGWEGKALPWEQHHELDMRHIQYQGETLPVPPWY